MELIDTHCHLNLSEYDEDRPDVIARARETGISHMVVIGIDCATSRAAIDLAVSHADISATAGHHPHEAEQLRDEDLDELKSLAGHPEVVGFGEIGLDFFRDRSPRDIQKKRFDDLIRIGLDLDLPLIIHDRDAHEDILEHLTTAGAGGHKGVIHCYSGDYQMARKFLDLGFYISIPGTVTFPKNHVLRDVVARLPLDTLLVETDAPFLAPVPKRGRRNEPAYVRHTAMEVAKIKGISLEEAAEATTRNARTLFGLDRGVRP